MNTNRSGRIDRDTAEQLLSGARVGMSAGQTPGTGQVAALAGLLAAAAAPGPGGEPPGEAEALAAFREARRTPAAQTGRRRMANSAPARAFGVKAIAAVLATAALSGVAVAAGTGHLPAVLGGSPHRSGATNTTMVGHSNGPSGKGSAPGPGGAARMSAGAPGAPAGPTTGPSTPPKSPALAQLCRWYVQQLAGGAAQSAVLADPRAAPLAGAAGGLDRVAGYCADPTGAGTASPSTALPIGPLGRIGGSGLPATLPRVSDPVGGSR